jgi:hypothetical protein
MFKYMRADEWSLSNFRNSELRCRHFDDFNDPFECWCKEIRSIPNPVAEPERYARLCDAWLGVNSPPNEAIASEFAKYVDSLIYYAYSRVELTTAGVRISCFSETGDNLLMWAHYADGLRGFCIEFHEEELIRGKPQGAIVIKVNYSTAPVPFDLCFYEIANDQVEFALDMIDEDLRMGKPIDPKHDEWVARSRDLTSDMYDKLMGTKPVEWRYEREKRLILHAGSDGPIQYQYPDSAIKSVILGERMPDHHKAIVARMVRKKGLDVPIGVAKRDSETFAVIIDSYVETSPLNTALMNALLPS